MQHCSLNCQSPWNYETMLHHNNSEIVPIKRWLPLLYSQVPRSSFEDQVSLGTWLASSASQLKIAKKNKHKTSGVHHGKAARQQHWFLDRNPDVEIWECGAIIGIWASDPLSGNQDQAVFTISNYGQTASGKGFRFSFIKKQSRGVTGVKCELLTQLKNQVDHIPNLLREPVRKKIRDFLGIFPIRGGRVLLNPKTFVIWPSNFWHAKIILRC